MTAPVPNYVVDDGEGSYGVRWFLIEDYPMVPA